MKNWLKPLFAAAFTVVSAGSALAQSLDTLKDNRVLIHDVQERLQLAGYPIGTLDGAYGAKTGKIFEAFAKDKGLADATLAEKMLALGIDVTALNHLTFTITDDVAHIDNGIDNNFANLVTHYDWKSFDIGRYRISDDGIEMFSLDFGFCNRFGHADDCKSGRTRVQLRDVSEKFVQHKTYSFEFRIDSMPMGTAGNFQIAELYQQGGFKAKHPETGDPVTFTPKFTLEADDENLYIIDNALVDVNLFGGQRIKAAIVPITIGEWTKVTMDVAWGPDEAGSFRYWVNDKALWSRTGRNTNCEANGSTKGCQLDFKYGPYTSHLDHWGESAENGHIGLSIRNMRRENGADAEALVASLDQNFAATTERKGGATPDVEILTSEEISNTSGTDERVNTLFKSIIKGAAPGANAVEFNIQGKYSSTTERLTEMRFVVMAAISEKEKAALEACDFKDDPTDGWDGKIWPIINFDIGFTALKAPKADCLREALSGNKKASFMVDFLLTRFNAFASDMVTSGVAFSLQHEGLRNFMQLVADGTLKVSG